MRLLALLALFTMAATCQGPKSSDTSGWDKARVRKDLDVFTKEPHPMGSPRNLYLAEYIQKSMLSTGLTSVVQSFSIEVPDPEFLVREASMMQKTTLSLNVQNITAKFKAPTSKDCVFLIGSHYDSKLLRGELSLGANDSGSSSVALMELMRLAKARTPSYRCHLMAVWFDAEEAYLPQWSDGQTRHPARQVDNTYGSRYFAAKLKSCGNGYCLPKELGGEKVEGLILLDMIGSPNIRLSQDSNSTSELLELAKRLDREHFQGKLFANAYPKGIEDDHMPFLAKGIPAVDLIGFEDLEHWHQPSDTLENLDESSIEKVGRLTQLMLDALLL